MKIRQILNNNVALVQRGSLDLIVLSTGISFRKKVGDDLEASEIERTFIPDSNDILESYSYLLSHTSESVMNATKRIVDLINNELNEDINDHLYLSLLDHIDYLLMRAQKNQFIISPLAWEVRKFYPSYYELGKQSLKIITDESNIDLPESEAVSIALHLINLQETSVSIEDNIKEMTLINNILTIIKTHYRIQLDETSMNYNRLITHLRYFIQRLSIDEIYQDQESALNKQIRVMYPQAYLCVQKIRKFLDQQLQKDLSEDEETYLMLHIHRVTKRDESEE